MAFLASIQSFFLLQFQVQFAKIPFWQKFLWFAGFSLTGWVLAKLFLAIWVKLILPLASKTQSSLDDHLTTNVYKPITRLLTLGTIYLAAKLTITPTKEFTSLVTIFENTLFVLLVLFLANLANAVFKSFIDWYLQDIAPKTESQLDDTLFPMLRKVGIVVIYFFAITVILGRFKVNITAFMATAGVVSLAVAFAAQETLSNVIAGISILLDRSFHIDERIELKDGLIGDVVEIGLRSTKILSLDQRLIIVPNKEIAGSRLINWNQPDASTKVKLKIGVALNEDLDQVKKIIMDVCATEPLLRQEPASVVLCTGFGPYFIELLIIGTIANCRDSGRAIDQLAMHLQKRFKQENIHLPYPHQTIEMNPNSN